MGRGRLIMITTLPRITRPGRDVYFAHKLRVSFGLRLLPKAMIDGFSHKFLLVSLIQVLHSGVYKT